MTPEVLIGRLANSRFQITVELVEDGANILLFISAGFMLARCSSRRGTDNPANPATDALSIFRRLNTVSPSGVSG